MRVSVILLAVSLTLAFAPAPLSKRPPRDDLAAVQGDLEVVEWSMEGDNGQAFGLRPGKWRHEIDCQDNRANLERDRLALPVPGQWRVQLGGGLVTINSGGEEMLGIYKSVGGTLTICYNPPGKGRPEKFTNKNQWMLVLKRIRA